MTALTARQQAIYHWIVRRIESGTTPTYREIGRHFDISSPNGVVCHLKALETKGLLSHERGKPRTIRLPNRERTEELRQAVIDAAIAFVEPHAIGVNFKRLLLERAVEAYQRGTGK